MKKICVHFFSLYLLTSAGANAQSSPSPSPGDKGVAIGTTIREALKAAFPGATTLVDAIIGAAASKLKLKESDKESAKQAAQKPAEDKAAQAHKAANAELKKLDVLAAQLDVVITFADASSKANQQLLPLRIYLEAHSHPTQAEWTANVTSQWAVIQRALKDLDAYSGNSLNGKVQDGYINDLLRRIMSVKGNQVERLAKLITDTPQTANIGLIDQLLGELQPVFSDISRVTTLQVQTLSADLHGVVAQASEAEGSEDKLEKDLKDRYDSIKASLESSSKQ